LLAAVCSTGLAPRAEAQSIPDGLGVLAPERAFLVTDAGKDATGRQASAGTVKRDSVLNGVLIGAGVGALAGLIPDHYDDCEECHDSLYWSIGVGAGIGLLVDFLRNKPAPPPGKNLKAVQFKVHSSQFKKPSASAIEVRAVLNFEF
jgi:hypothetical protein